MGILSFIKGQLIDIIEWAQEDKNVLVWRFPDNDKEVKMGAQLTVREGQCALFVNEGKLADVFAPGRYELTTRNMPIMTTLKSWKYGFDSPFKVDVYFVNTQQFSNMGWGTKQPIMISDPEFSLVQMRAFGTFSFRVTDPAKFYREFAGNQAATTTEEILEHFRSRVVTEFSTALKKSGKTLAEINMRANELGAELAPIIQPDFDQIGLSLLRFDVESISLPEEIQRELTAQDMEIRAKRRTMSVDNEMEMQNLMNKAQLSQNIGDMNKYMQFQASTSMNNPALGGGEGGGGGMGDMMKMMMQMNMANQMMQNMGGLNPNAQPQAQTPAAPAASGPAMTREEVMASLKELGELKSAGILTDDEFNTKKAELLARL